MREVASEPQSPEEEHAADEQGGGDQNNGDRPLKVSLAHSVDAPDVRFMGAVMEHHPRSSWGPNVRDHYTLHVVTAGSGEYYLDGVRHRIAAGQCFMAPPGAYAYYHTDWEDIWTYWGVTFTGADCERLMQRCGLTSVHPVVDVADADSLAAIAQTMLDHGDRTYTNGLMLQSLLLAFLAMLIETGQPTGQNIDPKENDYIEQAVAYIETHLSEPLQVADVAEALFISRTYLTALFNKHLRISPKIFIMKAKMFEAAEKLRYSTAPISQIAAASGYATPFAFTKAFKRIMAMTPREFRAQFTAPDTLKEG